MINERDAADLLKIFELRGITVWVGGGWGVDALVGMQTRPHNDIDIYVDKKLADDLIQALIANGYFQVTTEYTTGSHTVWYNSANHIVDLHLIEFKAEDVESLYFEGEAYPLFVLEGTGTIGGVAVQCFTAEAQVLFHQGYEHSEKDVHDVLLLCKKFGLEVPEGYASA